MITNPVDYYSHIIQIADKNRTEIATLLPVDEKIYDIDLNKRTTSAPDFLSVMTDRYAETIYFKVDRFYDHMDLADTVCIIQYTNSGVPEDEGHIYLVPFFDITTYYNEKKILFPWQVSDIVTKAAGTITFSIRFFKIITEPAHTEENEKGEQVTIPAKNHLIYSLNIQPCKSKILLGLNLNLPSPDEYYPNHDLEQHPYDYLISEVNRLSKMIGLYWIDDLSKYIEDMNNAQT